MRGCDCSCNCHKPPKNGGSNLRSCLRQVQPRYHKSFGQTTSNSTYASSNLANHPHRTFHPSKEYPTSILRKTTAYGKHVRFQIDDTDGYSHIWPMEELYQDELSYNNTSRAYQSTQKPKYTNSTTKSPKSTTLNNPRGPYLMSGALPDTISRSTTTPTTAFPIHSNLKPPRRQQPTPHNTSDIHNKYPDPRSRHYILLTPKEEKEAEEEKEGFEALSWFFDKWKNRDIHGAFIGEDYDYSDIDFEKIKIKMREEEENEKNNNNKKKKNESKEVRDYRGRKMKGKKHVSFA